MADKSIEALIRKTQKAVDAKKKKERPSYDDSIVRSDKAENQEDLNEQFNYMRRREN